MKLVSFRLMPYRPLDIEEAAKHRSAWVVLPNRLYDPVKGAEEYARHIDALVYAEALGFDATQKPQTFKLLTMVVKEEDGDTKVAKAFFHRLRPYSIDPGLKTCEPVKPGKKQKKQQK